MNIHGGNRLVPLDPPAAVDGPVFLNAFSLAFSL